MLTNALPNRSVGCTDRYLWLDSLSVKCDGLNTGMSEIEFLTYYPIQMNETGFKKYNSHSIYKNTVPACSTKINV
jgi:hypothetical protein